MTCAASISQQSKKILPRAGRVFACCILVALAARVAVAESSGSPSEAAQNHVSLADYQAKLQSLDQIVAACQRAMIPANCQSDRVGPDIEISTSAGTRPVRFAWLRAMLDEAGKHQEQERRAAKEKAEKKQVAKPVQQASAGPPRFKPPTLQQQLEDGRKRLAADFQFAEQLRKPGDANFAKDVIGRRQTLDRILAAKEYHPAVVGPSLLQRALEKVGNWIDTIVGALQRAGFQSKWIGLTAEIVFVLLLSVALVWFLIRLERQGRMRSAFLPPGTGVDAPSARDWQLWLEDASRAASQGAWRDAIHLLYWASISRLESSGAWPVDRARTPREYLALVAADSAQRAGLAMLTGNFERTWYGGRPAAEADFRKAEQLAAELGANPAAAISPSARSGGKSRGAQ